MKKYYQIVLMEARIDYRMHKKAISITQMRMHKDIECKKGNIKPTNGVAGYLLLFCQLGLCQLLKDLTA